MEVPAGWFSLSRRIASLGVESSTDGEAPPADAGRLGPDLAPFQLRQRHFVLDFFAHREDDLVAGNVMSLLIALEQARSTEALALERPQNTELEIPLSVSPSRLPQGIAAGPCWIGRGRIPVQ